MILELGSSSFEVIRVTAEYSNAVLVAVLPYISDVAQKLDLPVAHPVTAEHVIHCSVLPNRRVAVEVGIRGGWVFAFDHGYVNTIQSDHSYSMLQDPDQIPLYFGEVNMSKAEAIQLARNALAKLNIPLESVFAEQEPQVGGPWRIGTNTVPHYFVTWPDPRGGVSAAIEVNGERKRIERVSFAGRILERAPPKVSVVPPRGPSVSLPPRINREYARELIPILLRSTDAYGQKLSLPVPRPLTTNHVARIHLQENRGGPYCELDLTNGWRFLYEHDMVTAYYAADDLFSSRSKPINIKQLQGKWNLTEEDAKNLVRKTLAKLNYPTDLIHMDFEPQVTKPAVSGIPRFMFSWSYSLEGDSMVRSLVSAEVDADKGEVKSLYYGNMVFGNRRPPIEVPLLLPEPIDTNQPFSQPRKKPTPTRAIPKAVLK